MTTVTFGHDEKYTGRIDIEGDRAIITVAEWSEWDNGEEAVFPREQFKDVVALLEAGLNRVTVTSILIGDEKYAGRIQSAFGLPREFVAEIEVAEWREFSNSSTVYINEPQAREIITLLS